MAIPNVARSFDYDTKYQAEWANYGSPGILKLIPDFRDPNKVGKEAEEMQRDWASRGRDKQFTAWRNLLAMKDENKGSGLESMVTNDARTLFSLATFLITASGAKRTISVGGQPPEERTKSGESERALDAWWGILDEERLRGGQHPFLADLAYWVCLYGWYAVEFGTYEQDGEMRPFAVPHDPSTCYPHFADGLERFARIYDTSAIEAHRIALRYDVSPSVREGARVRVADWYWRSPYGEVFHAIVARGLSQPGWTWLAEPELLSGGHIPVLVGTVGGHPDSIAESGSVFWRNERVYQDFNRWLSYFEQLAKEHTKAPILTKNVPDLEEKHISPVSLRQGAAVIQSTDPEASITRVDMGRPPVEVAQLLAMIDGMLQRGGFPYIMYGGIGGDLSGFAISQLLQTAEALVGPQARTLARIDSIISQSWLEAFRDGSYGKQEIFGYEKGNPRKPFVEEFGSKDVPKMFRVTTDMPIRVGNDLMARMSIARQAFPEGQLLDHTTVLEELLQMQDPALIQDRISEDMARKLELPLVVVGKLKLEAARVRASGDPGAAETADLLDGMADTMIEQQRQATAPAARERVAPEMMPPEARGVSPDMVRSVMRGPQAKNVPAEEQ